MRATCPALALGRPRRLSRFSSPNPFPPRRPAAPVPHSTVCVLLASSGACCCATVGIPTPKANSVTSRSTVQLRRRAAERVLPAPTRTDARANARGALRGEPSARREGGVWQSQELR